MNIRSGIYLLVLLLMTGSNALAACGNRIDIAITIGSRGLVYGKPGVPLNDDSLGVIYSGELYILRENGRQVAVGMANEQGQVRYKFKTGEVYQLDNLQNPRVFVVTDKGCDLSAYDIQKTWQGEYR